MSHKPNILWIVSDQHSPHISGFAGNGFISTPNLDNLAEKGMVFTAANCQSPLCVPSRTSFLTGKYPYRCSAYDNNWPLFPEHETIPGWFSKHGYVTAAVGKMHFRGQEQMHGWQYRPYGDLIETGVLIHQPDPPETADGRAQAHAIGRFPFAGESTIPESMHQDRVVTWESLAWLKEYASRGEEKPWLFCASYYRPHFPLTAPGRYFRKYLHTTGLEPELPGADWQTSHPHDRYIVEDFRLADFSWEQHHRALAAYYASVEYLDACIGELLDGLAAEGLLNDTIVVYHADHGELAGEHGLWWKRSYYDASAGVPLIVHMPGQSVGSTVNVPVELVDLFPSFCEWAQIPKPDGLDGESLQALAAGEPDQREKTYIRSELLGETRHTRFRMVRDQSWKLVEFPGSPARLFRLADDPGENHALPLDVLPEGTLADLRSNLRRGLDWQDIDAMIRADGQRRKECRPERNGSVHYRLPDGRIMDADAELYRSKMK